MTHVKGLRRHWPPTTHSPRPKMKVMKRSHSVFYFCLCVVVSFCLYPTASLALSPKGVRQTAPGLTPCGGRLPLVSAVSSLCRRSKFSALCYKNLDDQEETKPLKGEKSIKNNPRVAYMAKTMIQSLPSELRTKTHTRNETNVHVHDLMHDDKKNKTSRFLSVAKRVKGFPKRPRNKISSHNKNKTEAAAVVISNVQELRDAVLVDKIPLKDVDLNISSTKNYTDVTNHPVMVLLAERVRTNSTPSNRAPSDDAHIALSIEGGGMRGAVSAGMAAAIASLGLIDAFDSIYGSSAGCVVGAYMVSRQMCLDVYTDVLPAAKGLFACKRRIVGNLGVGIVNDAVARLSSKTENGRNDERNPVATTINNLNATTISGGDSVEAPRRSKTRSLLPFVSPVRRTLSQLKPYFKFGPGMNISFVLDGIMSEQHGLRPFDLEAFRINDAKQPLKIVSSTVRGGKLESVAFGSSDGDFWDTKQELVEEVLKASKRQMAVSAVKRVLRVMKNFVFRTGQRTWNLLRKARRRRGVEDADQEQEKRDDMDHEGPLPIERSATSLSPGRQAMSGLSRKNKRNEQRQSWQKNFRLRKTTESTEDPNKKGFFACMEASMLVPGAAGPPIKLLRSKHREESETSGVSATRNTCFDAFCYEPIPFRSAVEDGATHVLALRSRPDGCAVETKPAVYERVVAPVYFRLNGLPSVAEYFSSGGSQYRYLEDVMTLDHGLAKGCGDTTAAEYTKGVKVPPTDILFGTDKDEGLVVDTDTWKRAHLLPVKVPQGTPELPSLTQDKDEVTQAVRHGYAAAFDTLAPIVGLDSRLEGQRVAELLFPERQDDDMRVLETPVKVKGDAIEDYYREEKARRGFIQWMAGKRAARRKTKEDVLRDPTSSVALEVERTSPDSKLYAKQDGLDWLEAEALLAALPGFNEGKLNHLSVGLRSNRTHSG